MPRLGLGTVQFGLDYGIARRDARPGQAEVAAILKQAAADGCAILDTAAAYGDSELVIAQAMPAGIDIPIVTKCPPLGAVNEPTVAAAIRDALEGSLSRLGRPSVAGYLAHDASLLLGPAGSAARAAFRQLREEGLASKIGASVYGADEIDALLAVFDPDIVQLPVSILDQRLIRSGALARLRSRGVEVHARSVLLQGAVAFDPDALPPNLVGLAPYLRRLRAGAAQLGLDPVAAALRFARDCPEIDVVLVGAQSLAEWSELARAFGPGPGIDASGIACDDPDLVDPRRWSKA
jgi:aryl-alcohol dehydrogenase-like predicted oxidoreductase